MTAARTAPAPGAQWGLVGIGSLAAVMGGVAASVHAAEPQYWLCVLWVAWLIAMSWALLSATPSLAVAGIQVFFLLEVLAPATIAVRGGRTLIAVFDVSAGTVGALQLSTLAQLGVLVGALGARAWQGTPSTARLRVVLPAHRLDRWSIGLLLAAVAAMGLYVVVAGGNPRSLVVLVGSARYGDFLRSAEGPVVKYLGVLLGLAGVAIVVATLRLTSARARSRLVPVAVIGVSALVLISGGARWWLAIPAVAATLVWWKTSSSPWALRPRRLLIFGSLALFVMAVLVGGLRNQADVKSVDTDAFLAKQLSGGVFATTAVLVDTVPSQHPYLGGTSYAELLVMPVPRAVWPEKPEGEVKELQRAFFGQELGASFALYGEGYANFGWLGAGVASLLFGLALESAWLKLVAARTAASVVAWAMVVPMLLQLFSRGYLAGLLAGLFGFAVGLAWVVRGLRRLPASTREAAPPPPAAITA
jgi:hypothetical protein